MGCDSMHGSHIICAKPIPFLAITVCWRTLALRLSESLCHDRPVALPWLARMHNAHKPVAVERRGALDRPTLSVSLLALLFWWQSLTPTLIPRSWVIQTAIGAICLAIGYGIGTLAGRGVHRILERWGRVPSRVIRQRSWIVLAAA